MESETSHLSVTSKSLLEVFIRLITEAVLQFSNKASCTCNSILLLLDKDTQ